MLLAWKIILNNPQLSLELYIHRMPFSWNAEWVLNQPLWETQVAFT